MVPSVRRIAEHSVDKWNLSAAINIIRLNVEKILRDKVAPEIMSHRVRYDGFVDINPKYVHSNVCWSAAKINQSSCARLYHCTLTNAGLKNQIGRPANCPTRQESCD
jgi:hypothetical protein